MKRNSLKHKILTSYFLIFALLLALILYICFAVHFILRQTGYSYRTNTIVETYNTCLENIDRNLNSYIKLHYYENINLYFREKNSVENIITEFSNSPDRDALYQKEYIIYTLTKSYLYYTDCAVTATRADKSLEAENYGRQAAQVYSLLRTEVSELNSMYFQNNRRQYNEAVMFVKKSAFSGIMILIIASIITFLMVLLFLHRSLKPLTEISQAAIEISKNNFELEPLTYSQVEEVENISNAFNLMIKSIREYVDTIWEKAIEYNKLEQKELEMSALYSDAQFKALQSQINPHFLFNTLNTGAQLAMLEDADRTSLFLEKTADYYRYNLQNSGEVSTLGDELESVDNYIYIMKVRFGQKFNFEKNVELDDVSMKIPGMILQPLVEDCIKHGLGKIIKGGIIGIRVFKNSYGVIFIEVWDNGCGFPMDIRERLLKNMDSGNREQNISKEQGIGLENVISRLRIFYKNEEVFDITENEGGGTKFIIRINDV